MDKCEGCGHGPNDHHYASGMRMLVWCEIEGCYCPFYWINLPDPGDYGGNST